MSGLLASFSLSCLEDSKCGNLQGMVAQQIVGALSGGYNRPPQGPDRKHLEESVRVIVDKCLTLDPDSRPPLEDIIVILLSLLETPLEGKERSKEGD